MVYIMNMKDIRIMQLPIFTKLVTGLLSDLEFWELQDELAERPAAGTLIPGGKGLRKLRWMLARGGRGKRGGVRVIYYWRPSPALLCFVTIYAKSSRENLTPQQLKLLARLVEEQIK